MEAADGALQQHQPQRGYFQVTQVSTPLEDLLEGLSPRLTQGGGGPVTQSPQRRLDGSYNQRWGTHDLLLLCAT